MMEYTWNDLHVGLRHEFEATFTAESAATFAALSGDRNPLHVDEAHAVSAGFPAPVLFGMLTSSLYSRLVGNYLPGKYGLLQGIDLDFSSPSYAGDQLRVVGEITHMTEAYHRFEIKAAIRRADGKLISKARIRVGFHAG